MQRPDEPDRALPWRRRGAPVTSARVRLRLSTLCLGPIALLAGGCLGPPVLEQQVLGYDEVTKALDEKLLLLNIARLAQGESVHFTSTSSIAATFDWTTTLGASGRINEALSDYVDLAFGASASENPTFSIIPVSGEAFTKRIATPFTDDAFQFLVFQGGHVDQIMRLMAAGIEEQEASGAFVRFIANDPRSPEEYGEFRRIAMHLQWLSDERRLFVRTLVYEETLIADFPQVPRAEDINNGFAKGFTWRQKPNGHFELTRLRAGRVAVLNFDPMTLTDRERFELDERIRKNPKEFVHLEIRPGDPGGELPLRGAIKLRSMFTILSFLARGVGGAQEYAVAPDRRTGPVEPGPAATLAIDVASHEPREDVVSVRYRDRYYGVADTPWDRLSFTLLGILFQATVGDVQSVGIPITISK